MNAEYRSVKKTTGRVGGRIISLMLALILALTIMPVMNVRAADFDYRTLIPNGAESADALAAKQVSFNGIKWYLTEYDESAGTATLFAAGQTGTGRFDDNSSDYAGSDIQILLDNMTKEGGSYYSVADAIVKVDLTDVDVTDAGLYLLSETELNTLSENIKRLSVNDNNWKNYWLRTKGPNTWTGTPQAKNCYPAAWTGAPLVGEAVVTDTTKIIRPAMKLDLSKVYFDETTKTFSLKQTKTVTFKVENGTWDDGNSGEKEVTLVGPVGEGLKLSADQIPAVGTKPGEGYKAGSWDKTPSADIAITEDTTYTYTYAEKNPISATVTFEVKNGAWDDNTAAKKTITLTGHEGDVLKLSADQIPAVGTKPGEGYKAGSWDKTPSADIAITEDTTYTYTYAEKNPISATVIFEVKNGAWDDNTAANKTITLTGHEGDVLKLSADQIPAVGTKPDEGYKEGSWDTTPSVNSEITGDTEYIYTYTAKVPKTATVTFKVVNGKWDDDTTEAKTYTLSGYEGDQLKLSADQIPAVGTKPNDTYKAGSWDVTPSTDTEITENITYTYTYIPEGFTSVKVVFVVKNGAWNDGKTTEKTVTLSGSESEDLKLAASDIPSVGDKPGEEYKEGSWDTTPSIDTKITGDTTYTYTYAKKDPISANVKFKVVNGSWDNGNSEDITETLSGFEGDTLTLPAGKIPAVGNKPGDQYKAGSWDTEPVAGSDFAAGSTTTYTYTYAKKDPISATVKFKVVNGSWDDGNAEEITETLSGLEGDTLTLPAGKIPAVGNKPGDQYKAGSWDVEPVAESTFAAGSTTTYTYTYAAKSAISKTVTFKVENGFWNDGLNKDKTVTLEGVEGDELKLKAEDIPAVGDKPDKGFETGAWDTEPGAGTVISEDVTYTYTYAEPELVREIKKLIPTEYQTLDEVLDLRVNFNGFRWYVIGYDRNKNTCTLFSAGKIGDNSRFDDFSNEYKSSDIKALLDEMTAEGGLFEGAADNIKPANLTDINPFVENVKLFLLGTDEAKALPETVRRTSDDGYWLRSKATGALTGGSTVYVENTGEIRDSAGSSVQISKAVRPALKIDLGKTDFISETKTFRTKQTVTPPKSKEELKATDEAQELLESPAVVISGNKTGDAVQYSLDNKTWSAKTPTAKEAGDYTVYYKVEGNDGFDVYECAEPVNVTIKKPDPVIPTPISATVTFSVVNGSWNDGLNTDKSVTLEGVEGDELKLKAEDIPAAGDKPDKGFEAGAWDIVPDAETVISEDTTYTYEYAENEKTAEIKKLIPTDDQSLNDVLKLKVNFNGFKWYVVDYDVEENTCTLFAAEKIGDDSRFDIFSNDYSASEIRKTVEGLTAEGNLFEGAAYNLKKTNLTDINPYVENVEIFLLGTEEAKAIPENVRRFSSEYWLRTTPILGGGAVQVQVNGAIGELSGSPVQNAKAVRPALKIDLDKTDFIKETKTFRTKQTVTPPKAAQGLAYTEEAQELLTSPTVVISGNKNSDDIKYSLDGTEWSSEIPTATVPGEYNVYYKVAGNDGFEDFECEGPLKVTISKAEPEPPYLVMGTYGDTLGDLAFWLGEGWSWIDDPDTSAGDAGENTFFASYISQDEYHKDMPYVEVTVLIIKAEQSTPAAPKVKEVTADTITLEEIENGEYKCGDGQWQSSPVFTGLTPETEYTFFQRLAEDNNYFASDDSEGTKASTGKPAPRHISATVTFHAENGAWDDGSKEDKTITLEGMEGDELKLAKEQIPAAGTKPDKGYEKGSWDIEPTEGTVITEDTTYTYTYKEPASASDIKSLIPTDDQTMQEVLDMRVNFNGLRWYVIDHDIAENTCTLFAADTIGDTSRFDLFSNEYKSSDIKALLDEMTSKYGLFEAAVYNIRKTNLTDVNPYVENAQLFLLSSEEAKALPGNVRRSGDSDYWLRSKATGLLTSGSAAFVGINGYVWESAGSSVQVYKGLRPALKIDLDKTEFVKETKTFKAAQAVTPPKAKEGIEYTGAYQMLLESPAIVKRGNNAEGAIRYSLDKENWSAEIPEIDIPGDYNVYYKAAGNDEFADFECDEPVNVKIAKADPEIPAVIIAVYGETLKDLESWFDEGWSWITDPDRSVGNAGRKTFLAEYVSPDDYHNDMPYVEIDVTVMKADQDTPAAPKAKKITGDTITLEEIENGEYKCGDGQWQDSPVFTGLSDNTEYTFYQRLAEDENHFASEPSEGTKVTASSGTPTSESVNEAISKLPENPTLTDKEAVEKAKKEYDSLSEEEKAKITLGTYNKLMKAVDAVTAAEVGKQIEDLPEKITKNNVETVKEAQKAYNALTDAQKKMVSSEDKSKLANAVQEIRVYQMGADGTAFGKGASYEAAENAILSLANDNDPAGSKFAPLMLKSTKQTKNSITLTWKKVSGAKTYVLYGNRCGKKYKMKKLATVKGKSYKLTSAKAKKLLKKAMKKGVYYKFIVVALDKNQNVVSASKLIHVSVKGNKKKANPTGLTVKAKVDKNGKKLSKYKAASAITIKKGKTAKLKASIKKAKKNKVKKHRNVIYESSNTKIATVTKTGKIKGIKKGTCTVYAYTQNGIAKKIKVTVK